uniref:Uncharacterized protein n=1 Tax=Cacopsylla melanoneura TaxID=428564 RepID=A0A8D9EYK9_9HEMI
MRPSISPGMWNSSSLGLMSWSKHSFSTSTGQIGSLFVIFVTTYAWSTIYDLSVSKRECNVNVVTPFTSLLVVPIPPTEVEIFFIGKPNLWQHLVVIKCDILPLSSNIRTVCISPLESGIFTFTVESRTVRLFGLV